MAIAGVEGAVELRQEKSDEHIDGVEHHEDFDQFKRNITDLVASALKARVKVMILTTTVIGEDLGLVDTNPNIEWAFSYRYPSDSFFFRRILSGTRNEPPETVVPYRIGRDGTGLLIFTDMQDATAEYTINANDPAKYPEDFALALSYLVAFLAAPRITRGDPFKLRQSLYQLYQSEINNSNVNARNEEHLDLPPTDEFTRARR